MTAGSCTVARGEKPRCGFMTRAVGSSLRGSTEWPKVTNGFWAPFYRPGSCSLSCVAFASVLIVSVTCETEKPFRPPKLVWICFQYVFSFSVSSQETAHSFSVYSSAGLGFGSDIKHSLQHSVEGRAHLCRAVAPGGLGVFSSGQCALSLSHRVGFYPG